MHRRPFLRSPGALLGIGLLVLLAACTRSGLEEEAQVPTSTTSIDNGSGATASSQGNTNLGSNSTSDSTSGGSDSEIDTTGNHGDDSASGSDGTATAPPGTTTTTAPPGTITTTAPSDTTSTSSQAESGSGDTFGVVGCSNTAQSVTGYTELSSIDKLTPSELGGGSVPAWGDPSDSRYRMYWRRYDDTRPVDGYDGAWVQLCLRVDEHGGAFDEPEQEWVSHIVDQIQARDPGITIWMSPLNFYDGFVCDRVGPDGPAIGAQASDWAASMFSSVQRGPDLGPLQLEHVADDLCHPNFEGRLLLGGQLVAFFD